ncbi:MAG: hypothetical protein AB7G75_32770 [Candidatus Binatia bacterium]
MASVRLWAFLFCSVTVLGCSTRLYPPIAIAEYTNAIYPEPRPQNCKLKIFSSPPSEPHEAFARIVSYAGSAEMSEKMETLIKAKACEEGAEAIILLPMQHVDHVNTDHIYPDQYVDENPGGLGQRYQRWSDKRYSVAQRAIALVKKRSPSSQGAP